MKFRLLKAGNQVDRYNKLFTADDTLDDVIEKYLLNKITKDDVLFYMNWNEFDEDDVDWDVIEKEHKKSQIKKSKLLKASEWKVERRHHDTENGKDYYYIWGPDGEYCDADGEPYRFDTREKALEELEYLRAEHKGNEKAKKVKSAYGYDTLDEVLEMQIKYLKSIKSAIDRYLELSEEQMKEIEQGYIDNNLDKYSMLAQVEYLEKLVKVDDIVNNELYTD